MVERQSADQTDTNKQNNCCSPRDSRRARGVPQLSLVRLTPTKVSLRANSLPNGDDVRGTGNRDARVEVDRHAEAHLISSRMVSLLASLCWLKMVVKQINEEADEGGENDAKGICVGGCLTRRTFISTSNPKPVDFVDNDEDLRYLRITVLPTVPYWLFGFNVLLTLLVGLGALGAYRVPARLLKPISYHDIINIFGPGPTMSRGL